MIDAPRAPGRLTAQREAEIRAYVNPRIGGSRGVYGFPTRDLLTELDATRAELTALRAERDRETELRREAEAHVRLLQASLAEKPYPDEVEAQAQEIARLREALKLCVLPNRCRYSIGNICQAHGEWRPCSQEIIAQVLAADAPEGTPQ